MGILVWVLVAVGIAAGAVTVVETYKHAITRAEAAEVNAEKWKKSAADWKQDAEISERDYQAANKLGKQRNARLEGSLQREASLENELEALRVNNQSSASWLASGVDPAVRSLRRTRAGCSPDPELPCPGSKSSANTSTSDDGQNKQGVDQGSRDPA